MHKKGLPTCCYRTGHWFYMPEMQLARPDALQPNPGCVTTSSLHPPFGFFKAPLKSNPQPPPPVLKHVQVPFTQLDFCLASMDEFLKGARRL